MGYYIASSSGFYCNSVDQDGDRVKDFKFNAKPIIWKTNKGASDNLDTARELDLTATIKRR